MLSRRILLLKSLCNYSTNAAAWQAQKQQNPHFLEGFLINSLGFSKEEALSTTNKVTHLKFSKNHPDLVVDFFQELGLSKAQIRSIVSSVPMLLSYHVDKTLQPKIRILQDLGISGSDIVKLLMNYKDFLVRGLNSQIVPCIQYLKNLLGSDEKVAKVIMRYCFLLHQNVQNVLAKRVEILQKTGLSKESISKLILKNPRLITQKDGWLEEKLHKAEYDLQIPRKSKMFYYGVLVVSDLSKSKMDMKFEVLRSFGWSEAAICSAVRKFPYLLGTSEDKMNRTWKFFTKELGYAPDYLAAHPIIFKLNFEKRVKPRIEVLKILNEKKLNKRKAGLSSVLKLSEPEFVNRYLLPYKDDISDVCNSYFEIDRRE